MTLQQWIVHKAGNTNISMLEHPASNRDRFGFSSSRHPDDECIFMFLPSRGNVTIAITAFIAIQAAHTHNKWKSSVFTCLRNWTYYRSEFGDGPVLREMWGWSVHEIVLLIIEWWWMVDNNTILRVPLRRLVEWKCLIFHPSVQLIMGLHHPNFWARILDMNLERYWTIYLRILQVSTGLLKQRRPNPFVTLGRSWMARRLFLLP